MNISTWLSLFLIVFSCSLSGCGGGSNVVSNSTDGILSIEHVNAPTGAGGQGSVAIKLVAPTGGAGTGAVSIVSGNSSLVAFTPATQSVNSAGEALFYFTAKEVADDTIVPFTVTVGTLSLTNQITLRGTGAINLAITLPASVDAAGTITAAFTAGAQAAGRKIAISAPAASGSSATVAFDTTEQPADANGTALFSYRVIGITADTTIIFTAKSDAQSVSKQVSIPGPGTINLTVSLPASAAASGTITAAFAGGPQSIGRKITISADNTSNVSFATTEQTTDAQGKAVFSYRLNGLTADTIVKFTATSGVQIASKSVLIPIDLLNPPPPVTNPQVNSIAFISASPISISLKGTGGFGRTETSVVSFVVRDVTGKPLADQIVDFTLDTGVGGITIVPVSATSDASGAVKTIVNAGVVSTPVRVTATVRGRNISVKSDQLIISTGLPHQDGFSVSAPTLNPEAWSYDGVQVPVTVMLSDHFGNPVPDGTAVYFMAYGGSIEANAATKNGIATVNWRSQDPRPADGRAKILVYAIGEESFTDLNGNGLADPGEFTDLPEAFLAKSWTTDTSRKYCNPAMSGYNPSLDATNCLVRNPAFDPFIDFNGDGMYNSGDGKFNGVLQGSAYSGAPRSLNVFKNYQIVMSGSQAFISPKFILIGKNNTTDVNFTITDQNGNVLPEGTTVTFSSNAKTGTTTTTGADGKTQTQATCDGFASSPATTRLTAGSFQTQFKVSLLSSCDSPLTVNDVLTISVTTRNGIVTTESIRVGYR